MDKQSQKCAIMEMKIAIKIIELVGCTARSSYDPYDELYIHGTQCEIECDTKRLLAKMVKIVDNFES